MGRTEQMQDYYVTRPAPEHQQDYWAPKADPDGLLRDRNTEAERLQFVEDQRYLIDRVNAELPQAILDFGCGPGWLLAELDAGCKVGVETSILGSKLAINEGVYLVNNITDFPNRLCDCADVVIAHHVVEHLADPLYYLNQWRRVLRKGGLLVLATPDFGSPCAVRFGDNYRMLHDPTHISLFTLESCSRMLHDYGFTIEHVDFPFPDRYATAETMDRWRDTSRMSPPWPGNWMTFWARK